MQKPFSSSSFYFIGRRPFLQNYKFSNKNAHFSAWKDYKKNLCVVCRNFKSKISPIVAFTSSGILKSKQKLGITFDSDKLGGIDFTKFSKLTMCSA